MARTILNDDAWQQLQSIMTEKGFALGKRPTTDLIDGLRTDFGMIFLSYEAKLIRNGYPLMEATSALISMQLELGVVKIEQLGEEEAERQQRYTWPLIRMDARSILKSLGVKSTTVKLQTNNRACRNR